MNNSMMARISKYDDYHATAAAVFAGNATREQIAMVQGLGQYNYANERIVSFNTLLHCPCDIS